MSTLDLDRENELKARVPRGSRWAHRDSTLEKPRYYLVVGYARSTKTCRLEVLYWALYEGDFPTEEPWSRDIEEFLENVVKDDQEVPRFTQLP